MTRPSRFPGGGSGSAALRWSLAAAGALGLHAGVAALVIRGARPEPLDSGGGDAVAVELAPMEGEVPKPDDLQPLVPADGASTAAAASSEASQAAPTPVPPSPSLKPPPPPPNEAVPDVPASPPPVAPEPKLAKAPDIPAPATLPVQATQASDASTASAAAEDATRAVQKRAAGRDAAWRGRLVPHLNRFRRFPPDIGSGTARVGFTIDGEGRVTAVSIASSSGDAALDAAARALVQRASPFPAPPAGVTGRALSFVVPVHYDARRP